MDAQKPAAPSIALLALPESTPGALFGLYEVFLSVGRTWQDLTGEPPAGVPFSPKLVARGGAPVATALGIPVQPHEGLGDADIVIVTDLALPSDESVVGRWPEEAAWLRARYDAGAVICSVCTGAVLLAEAGLLDGLNATTHWSAVDLIRTCYPGVQLVPQRILTAAGDGDRIVTSGGASAWEDLALYLVARFSSGTEAVRIAKIFLLGDHSEGQLPFAGARKARRHEDAVVGDAQAWIADNYHRPNPVARMVERSGLPERTFVRRFRAATGYAPMDYVQTLRIEEAKHLLETTALPVEEVAVEVGYEDPNFLRRLFRRRVGITPAKYRQRFSRLVRIADG